MILGQNFRCGFYEIPPAERMDAIRRAGFDAVMFWWGNEFDSTDGDKHLRMRLAIKNRLKVNTLHFPSTFADRLWRKECCEEYADEIIDALRDCATYGVENLVLHTTRKLITPPFNEEGLNAIGRASVQAEKLGVNIALENTRFPAYNAYIYKNIPSPRLTLCYDTGHEHCYTKDKNILDLFGDKLSTTHIHDNDGTCDQHHLMGEGNINFAPIFDRLKKLGLKYYNLESYCDEKSRYYGKCSLSEFLSLSYRTLTGFLTDSDRVFSLRG